MRANLRVLKRAAAIKATKRPTPREVKVTLKPEQVEALEEYSRAIDELKQRMQACMIGILTGHGVKVFSNANLEGNRLTLLDQTACAAWDAANPPKPAEPPADKKG
jgi:hypothetical protein